MDNFYLLMKETQWLDEKVASKELGVSPATLKLWREVGYLKPGTHWRSAPHDDSLPWTPNVIYHLSWCKEVIEYWKDKDAPITTIAA
ncbi:hypothetical protein [Prochlorococcus marinus]|uniref:Uncharacterized protein n=1 Tax=Prochlorococcus marinus (strain MIT 9211) TaxID=93059 RepID=A9BA00_PROM4|nr:hypothetical protein [Prochlorococcus marinus]ABX08662.1 Hypothetical protein P9211_07311 [Prochlorococcus marinus str. MIT 9211]